MKRFSLISMLATAAVLLLGACSDSDDDGPSGLDLTLTTQMVEVGGELAAAPLINVDNKAAKIDIEISYADHAKLAALAVSFVQLPDGVTASPNGTELNYADGARNNVTFNKGNLSKVYSVGVAAAAPDPKFISATLNEVPVTGVAPSFTAQLKGSDDLTAIRFAYVVSPEETVVTYENAQGEFIAVPTGEEETLDFSDKLNGVNFRLTCGEIVRDVNIKVSTSGISKVERVWGHYVQPQNTTDDFFGTAVAASGWERTIAMDDSYVYMAKAKAGADKGCYAISIADPSQVKELSVNGINEAGVFHTSDAKVIDNGNSSVLLLCNLVNAKDSHLYVYAYTSVDADPTVALDYVLPEAHRLGDKFTVEGDWQNGKLWFFNQMGTTPRNAYVFSISGGTINATPEIVSLDTSLANLGGIASMFRFSATEYLWAGAGTYPVIYGVSGGTYTQTLVFNNDLGFTQPMHGIGFFSFNDQNYMSFVRLENSYQDATLRIMELNATTLQESIEHNNISTNCYIQGLGDPDEYGITAAKNGNGLGDAVVRVINGETYIAAMAPGAGVSLFKLVK